MTLMQIVGLGLVLASILSAAILTAAVMIDGAIRALARDLAEESFQQRKQLGEHFRLEELRAPSRLPSPPRVPVFPEDQLRAIKAQQDADMWERQRDAARRSGAGQPTSLGIDNQNPRRG